MTYLPFRGPRLAAALGTTQTDPALLCDKCDVVLAITTTGRRGPPRWLIEGKAPRGWRRLDRGDLPARHVCPSCRKAGAA